MPVAVKVIRSVKRYIKSAKIESEILDIVLEKGGATNHVVQMIDHFEFKDETTGLEHYAIVFEPLGKSLFEFYKANKYRGFPIH